MIPYGPIYCDACAPIVEAEREAAAARKEEARKKRYNRAYNKRRDPKYLTFYRSKAWRTLSKAFLSDAGYKCQAGLGGCQGLATEAHHVQPIQTEEGWERRLDWDNLEAVCTSCHNKRHPEKFKSNRSNDFGVIDMKLLK